MDVGGRGHKLDRSQSLPGTPKRKSDQWHRLASVVRSSQKTFVPAPYDCAPSELKCRTKLTYPTPTKNNSFINQRSLSLGTASKQPLKNSQSRMRSLSRAYSEAKPEKAERKSIELGNQVVYGKDKTVVRDTKDFIRDDRNSEIQNHSHNSYPHSLRKKPLPSVRSCDKGDSTDPYSFKYLRGFGIVCALAMTILILSWKIGAKESTQLKISRSLRQEDIALLRKNFREKIFGQHIATKMICNLMENMVSGKSKLGERIDNLSGAKIAVLSLHGWTGVGKTFLTQIFVDSVAPEKYMRFVIPVHFPHSTNEHIYRSVMLEAISTNLTKCGVNVVIFDEMDKASVGVVKGIADTLLQLKVDNSYKDSTVLVLLVSNSLGRNINNRLFHYLNQGRLREDLTLSDFGDIFYLQKIQQETSSSFHNDPWYRLLTEQNLIDTFVPFLPLNLDHVKECVKRRLEVQNVTADAVSVEKICDDLSLFLPPGSAISYSHTGCKRVSEKVDLHFEPLL